jgi:hypothetical protein
MTANPQYQQNSPLQQPGAQGKNKSKSFLQRFFPYKLSGKN